MNYPAASCEVVHFLNDLIDIRHNIVHFKENEINDNDLSTLTDLNYKKALDGITIVQNMIREYKGNKKYDTELYWMNLLVTDFTEIIRKLMKKLDRKTD
jgi:hypothetical protein